MEQSSDNLVTRDYFLNPGYIYMPQQPTVISTVLGSSVSVTLYDKSNRIGGMNHFLFPKAVSGEKATALYGNIAVIALIRMMMESGAKPGSLEAQIFGGAFNGSVSGRDIGRDNFRCARNILNRKNIRIVSEDVGGQRGRKIVFNTQTGELLTLKVERLRQSDWYPYRGDR